MMSISSVNLWQHHGLHIMLLFFAFFAASNELCFMGFISLLYLLLSFLRTLILIGSKIPLIDTLFQVIASFWVIISFHGVTRNKFSLLGPALKLNIVFLLTLLKNLFDFNGFSRTWELLRPYRPVLDAITERYPNCSQ